VSVFAVAVGTLDALKPPHPAPASREAEALARAHHAIVGGGSARGGAAVCSHEFVLR